MTCSLSCPPVLEGWLILARFIAVLCSAPEVTPVTRVCAVSLALLALACLPCSQAFAQPKPPSSWGVSVGIVPKWESSGSIKKLATLIFTEDNGEIDLRGSEFRIGLARGRWLGGGWEVSLVQKKFA